MSLGSWLHSQISHSGFCHMCCEGGKLAWLNALPLIGYRLHQLHSRMVFRYEELEDGE